MRPETPRDPSIVDRKDLLSVAGPVERKSNNQNFWNFAKSGIMIVVVTKLSSLAGYYAGRGVASTLPETNFLKQEVEHVITGAKTSRLAAWASYKAGAIGGFYELWKSWSNNKIKQMGVQDIHKDIYTELDPKLLQAELEQNQRIQDGITALARNITPREAIAPRGSHTQEALKEDPAAAMGR